MVVAHSVDVEPTFGRDVNWCTVFREDNLALVCATAIFFKGARKDLHWSKVYLGAAQTIAPGRDAFLVALVAADSPLARILPGVLLTKNLHAVNALGQTRS